VYSAKVTSVQDLRGNIVCAVEGIPPKMCVSTLRAFEYWMDMLRQQKGPRLNFIEVKDPSEFLSDVKTTLLCVVLIFPTFLIIWSLFIGIRYNNRSRLLPTSSSDASVFPICLFKAPGAVKLRPFIITTRRMADHSGRAV
jgi:hypothetical protein